jgi:hypothetical protein
MSSTKFLCLTNLRNFFGNATTIDMLVPHERPWALALNHDKYSEQNPLEHSSTILDPFWISL